MRPTAASKALLVGLFTGGLIASGATPALATVHDGVAPTKPLTISVRLVSWRVRDLRSKPALAMLWYDDANGKKQLSSLTGGTTWLDSCINAFCPVE